MGGSRRRHIVGIMGTLVLAAVLLNTIYGGHWAAQALPTEAADMAVSDHDHSGHNHLLPTSGTSLWWAPQEAAVSLGSGQVRGEATSASALWPEPPLPHPSPPPRYL